MYRRADFSCALIIDDANKHALMVRNQNGASSYWSLPGGEVEEGETLEAALKRELKEETGLEVEAIGIYSVREVFFKEIQRHAVLFTFLSKIVGGELRICDPDHEIVEIKWMELETANQFMPYLTGNLKITAGDHRCSPYHFHGVEEG